MSVSIRALGASAAAGALLVLSACTTGPDVGPTTPPVDQAPPPSTPAASNGPVSLEQAGKIATNKYGGTVKGVDSDHYQGTEVWEVEVRDSDQGRIEVKVEKATGEILHMEVED